MTVWIVQCLCPDRHCILAAADVADGADAAEGQIAEPFRDTVRAMLRDGAINPWCGLCRAPAFSWRYECRRTKFATMAEAQPEFARLEAEQAATRAMFGDLRPDWLYDPD